MSMTNLKILKFSHVSKIRDEQFHSITQLTQLETLRLSLPKKNYPYSFLGSFLASLVNLRELKLLNFSGLSDKVLGKLPESITTLDLRDCSGFNATNITELGRLNELKILNLSKTNIDDDFINALVMSCPQLQSLSVKECRGVTNRSTPHLTHLSNIQHLNLTHTKISNSGIKHICKLTTLQTLILQRCTTINDSGVSLLSNLTNLTNLNLYSCNQITDSCLENLRPLTNLTSLNLSYCKNITNTGLVQLGKTLVNLKELYLYACNSQHIDAATVKELFPDLTKLAGLIQLKEVPSIEDEI